MRTDLLNAELQIALKDAEIPVVALGRLVPGCSFISALIINNNIITSAS